jgi:hypothetical protein
LRLCGMQLVLQATVCYCLALDPFAFEEDGLGASKIDVSWGEIVEALVIAGMVVVLDEGRDLAFEIAGQVVSCNPPPAWSPAYRSSFKLSTPLPRTSPRRGLPSRGAFGLLAPAPPWCEPRSSPAPSRRARHRCARGSTIRCLGIEVVAASSNSSRQTLARKG